MSWLFFCVIHNWFLLFQAMYVPPETVCIYCCILVGQSAVLTTKTFTILKHLCAILLSYLFSVPQMAHVSDAHSLNSFDLL